MNVLKQRFAEALTAPEVDLARLALLAIEILAVSSNPAGIRAAEDASKQGQRRLEALIAQARTAGAGESAAALVDHMSQSLGFVGNADDYYSADNSNLGWVLVERRGIPITLAIVYIEVGRALGFDLRGIGFPGHFLVGVYIAGDPVERQLIDPFSGKFVSREECMQVLARTQEPARLPAKKNLPVNDGLFAAGSPQQIILRLLENLKQIHLALGASGPAIAALDLQILIAPSSFELRAQHDVLIAQMFPGAAGRRSGQRDGPELH